MSTSSPTSATSAQPDPRKQRAARLQILLMLLVFASPVVLSYIWYFLVHPANGHIYGTLLEVAPLPAANLQDEEGKPFTLDSLKGKWVLVAQDVSSCEQGCQAKLYGMRQVRAALGHDDTRVERVLLLEDSAHVAVGTTRDYAGTHFLHLQGGPLATAFTPEQGDAHAHLWVVDPLGNLVLRYPLNADLKKVLKDMERLLKASQIG